MIGLLIIVAVILFIVIGTFISINNKIKLLQQNIEEARSDIEIFMVKRYDVIQNSLNLVKKYMEHEEKMFTNVIRIRQGQSTTQELAQAQVQYTKVQNKLLALAENYPELKSNTVFMNLQTQLTDENAHYAASKRMFNSNIKSYNAYIKQFPNSIVAGMQGCHEEQYLSDPEAATKRNADITF